MYHIVGESYSYIRQYTHTINVIVGAMYGRRRETSCVIFGRRKKKVFKLAAADKGYRNQRLCVSVIKIMGTWKETFSNMKF